MLALSLVDSLPNIDRSLIMRAFIGLLFEIAV